MRALTHLPLLPHIGVSESGQHWFRQWLIAHLTPSHYLNQSWVIVNWTLRNKLQWKFKQSTKLFIHKNASENIVCKMADLLSRERWVNCSQRQTNYLPMALLKRIKVHQLTFVKFSSELVFLRNVLKYLNCQWIEKQISWQAGECPLHSGKDNIKIQPLFTMQQ